MKILVINPGSTSTKIGFFQDEAKIFETVLRHSTEELAPFKNVTDQYEFRKEKILNAMEENDFSLKSIDAIACRGGATKKRIKGGTYLVTDQMCEEHRNNPMQHPASLAAIIGKDIADELGIKAYVTDTPYVCEISKIAEISGHQAIRREPIFHALNSKAIARKFAAENGKKYADINAIVCHMGGGISISCHQNGIVIDTTDGISEGPIAPERTGSLPARPLVDLCFSGEYTHADMKKIIQSEGGIYSYIKTNDMREVEQQALNGDEEALLLLDAMVYQIAKEIGAMATVLCGQLDGILLTGGIAYSENIVKKISERCDFLGKVKAYPGEIELEALALGVLRITNGEEELKIYN